MFLLFLKYKRQSLSIKTIKININDMNKNNDFNCYYYYYIISSSIYNFVRLRLYIINNNNNNIIFLKKDETCSYPSIQNDPPQNKIFFFTVERIFSKRKKYKHIYNDR